MKFLKCALAALLLTLGVSSCGGGGGSNSEQITPSSDWDQMKWDQDRWS